MTEPITKQLVAEVLEKLNVALPKAKGIDILRVADVYREALEDLSGEAVRWAAKQCVRLDKYFPKPARIRELANEWQRANVVHVESHLERPSGWCDGCQSVAKPIWGWRPALDEQGRRIVDARRMLLEEYERVRCLCDPAPDRYKPDVEGETWMTLRRAA